MQPSYEKGRSFRPRLPYSNNVAASCFERSTIGAVSAHPGAADAAYPLAEEIRTAFKHVAPDIVSGEANPTASFGIAIARQNEDLHALMDRADRALYRAKDDGRDCIRLAD